MEVSLYNQKGHFTAGSGTLQLEKRGRLDSNDFRVLYGSQWASFGFLWFPSQDPIFFQCHQDFWETNAPNNLLKTTREHHERDFFQTLFVFTLSPKFH